MANKNQQRGGQPAQYRNSDGSHDNSGNSGNSGNSENSGAVSRDYGYNPRETNANDQWEPENSRGPRGYGHSQSYGGALGYPDETLRSPQGNHKDAQSASGSNSGSRDSSDEESSPPPGNASHGSASTTPKSK